MCLDNPLADAESETGTLAHRPRFGTDHKRREYLIAQMFRNPLSGITNANQNIRFLPHKLRVNTGSGIVVPVGIGNQVLKNAPEFTAVKQERYSLIRQVRLKRESAELEFLIFFSQILTEIFT